MLNCYALNLPKLSDQLVKELLEFAQSNDSASNYDSIKLVDQFNINRWDDFHAKTSTNKSSLITFQMSDDLKIKVHNELFGSQINFEKINLYFQTVEPNGVLAPHTDPLRKVGLVYNLSADYSTTHFYNDLVNNPNQFIYSVDDVSPPIESITIRPYHWYVFNNFKPHGVTDVTKKRIALTANLDTDPIGIPNYETFCDQYKDILVHPDGLEPPTFAV